MDIPADSQYKLSLMNGFSSVGTIRYTYEVAKTVLQRGIQGCFVECGVATGGGSAPMALALVEMSDHRPLHLFDSFEGLPHCGVEDHGQMGNPTLEFLKDPTLPVRERLVTTGISVGTLDQVKSNFQSWGVKDANVIYHKGWFQDTLPGLALAPIAFLRLDGDLYESTMCCMEHLYPQVVQGGYIWLDEFGMPEFLGGHKAVNDYFNQHPELPRPVIAGTSDTGAAFWIKQ